MDFEQIYSEYFPRVYRYLLSLCSDPSLAEELTQDTFYRAIEHSGIFRGECKLSVWLCRIARNCWLSHMRREKRKTPFDDSGEAAGAEPEVPPQTYDEEKARVLRGVKKHYTRIRWRAVITAVIAAVAVTSLAAMAAYHFYWPTHHHYPEIQLYRRESVADARFARDEYYAELIGAAWASNPQTDKKLREFVLWNHTVDLELHYVYIVPYDVRVSGEVKDGKTTLRYEGYVTTQDGKTIEYKNEMAFDGAFGPEGELFIN